MLSLILPTFNESKNLPELIGALEKVLTMKHEIIVVDDNSPDKTWEVAEELKKHHHTLRVLRRVGRRGLSSAVTEGFAIAQGDVLMVMDSDLQHDPHLVIDLYDAIKGGADIAVASRYMKGGSVGEWVRGRRYLSKAGTYIAHALPPVHSSDPMSGFFAVSSKSYEPIAKKLYPTGFKILLEVLAALPAKSKLTEIPLQFSPRKHGESKLNMKVQWQFVLQIVRIATVRLFQWLRSYQFSVFLIACGFTAVLVAPRVWAIHLLYTDATVRKNVQHTMKVISDTQGWLISDMEVLAVYKDHIRIDHREHRKGGTVTCFDLPFDSISPALCSFRP